MVALVCHHTICLADDKLSGSVITSGGSNPQSAFDGNSGTVFSASDGSKAWIGLALPTQCVITKVGWARSNDSRVELGLFEGANNPQFLDAVPLAIIEEDGNAIKRYYKDVNVSRGFKYVRYVGPHDSHAKIAELEFYGHEGVGDDTQFCQLTNLPVVTIHTQDNQDPWDKYNDIVSYINIIYDNGTKIQEENGTTRYRGNTSMGFEKKPYRIKFESKKHFFKGSELYRSPAKCKKWVLSNSPDDKTLMRNILGFELSKRMGLAYTPFAQAVDLIYNGEYKGCYQLLDQITIDKDRVNIPEMAPEDIFSPEITGGYLLEVDALAEQEKSCFWGSNSIPVTIKSPDENDITAEQRRYIENVFNAMSNSVFASNYRDKEMGYKSKLDMESFLRYFILEQFIANSDAFWSTYMYKNREDELLYTGPCWDLNLSMDNDNRSYPACNQSSWVFRIGSVNSAGNMRNFVNRILSDPAADKMLHDLWTAMRNEGGVVAESIKEYIDMMEYELRQSTALDNKRWGYLDKHLFNNPVVYGDYGQEVQVLRTFIENQIPWMDMQLKYGEDYIERETDFTINNADDLMKFAKEVNTGNTMANAVLTADIDLEGYDWTPIGSPQNLYVGSFDGSNHRIKNLNLESSGTYQGFFGAVSGGAVIRNLIIDSSCYIEGWQYVGGLIGGTNGSGDVLIMNCGNEAIVSATLPRGSANAGGLLGCNMSSGCRLTFMNCFNAGMINGAEECGAMSGWAGENASFINCYNIGEVYGAENNRSFSRRGGNNIISNCYQLSTLKSLDNAVSYIGPEEVANGFLCYTLNVSDNSWYQNLDNDQTVDSHPIPFSTHGKVYLTVDGNGYTNSPNPMLQEYYEISTPADLRVFAQAVALGNVKAKALLLNDIDMTGEELTLIGSTDHPYIGEFNGAGYIIDNINYRAPEQDAVGLFSVIGPGAYIHNLTIGTNSVFEGHAYVAGIAGCTLGAGRVEVFSCGNEARIISHDKNAAGIIGCNRHSEAQIAILDSYNTGNVEGGRENGALCGWLGNSSTVSRCYNSGLIDGLDNGQGLFRGTATTSDIYDLNSIQGEPITETDLTSGRLCYLLDYERSVWHQNIDNGETPDTHPVLVAHADVNCFDGFYTNKDEESLGIEINDMGADAFITSIEYFTLDGQRIAPEDLKASNQYAQYRGIYIRRSTYSNGTVKTKKVRI